MELQQLKTIIAELLKAGAKDLLLISKSYAIIARHIQCMFS